MIHSISSTQTPRSWHYSTDTVDCGRNLDSPVVVFPDTTSDDFLEQYCLECRTNPLALKSGAHHIFVDDAGSD